MKRLGLSVLLFVVLATAASAGPAEDKALVGAIMASDTDAALAALDAGVVCVELILDLA